MPGAGGRPEPKHFTCKMCKPGQDAVGDGGSVGIDQQPPAAALAAGPPAEAPVDNTQVPAVATAAAAGPAVAAAPPSPPGQARGPTALAGGGKGGC